MNPLSSLPQRHQLRWNKFPLHPACVTYFCVCVCFSPPCAGARPGGLCPLLCAFATSKPFSSAPQCVCVSQLSMRFFRDFYVTTVFIMTQPPRGGFAVLMKQIPKMGHSEITLDSKIIWPLSSLSCAIMITSSVVLKGWPCYLDLIGFNQTLAELVVKHVVYRSLLVMNLILPFHTWILIEYRLVCAPWDAPPDPAQLKGEVVALGLGSHRKAAQCRAGSDYMRQVGHLSCESCPRKYAEGEIVCWQAVNSWCSWRHFSAVLV